MRSRNKIWIDRSVQGALVKRVVTYWLHCLVTVAFMMTLWLVLTDPPRSSSDLFTRLFTDYGPVLVASLLLLPLVIVDCVRLSNRFVGPLFRLRRALRDLADGRDVPEQHFRQGDFWQDFADDFNRLSQRVRELEASQATRAGELAENDTSDLADSVA